MDQKKVEKRAKNLTVQVITSAAFENKTSESILSRILVLSLTLSNGFLQKSKLTENQAERRVRTPSMVGLLVGWFAYLKSSRLCPAIFFRLRRRFIHSTIYDEVYMILFVLDLI